MSKQRVSQDKKDDAADGIEGRDCQPENAQQVDMLLHAPRTRLYRGHWTDRLLAAPATKRMTGLN